MDAAGYVRITGRSKDIIIRAGENIPVKEIEDVLMQHPNVRSVAVVGLPDARLGEIACACIIPEPGETFTLPEMHTFLAAQQVTRQFWPERVQVMDAFPTTPSGKVQKFELRQMLAASERTEALLRPATAAPAR
jgi:cyclohexanecarboxylate-CoA ligase